MRNRNRAHVASWLVSPIIAMGLTLLGVQGVFSANAAQSAKPPFLILVAGDSYSAGNGAGSYSGPEKCRRSANNYAQVFAATLRKAPYNQPTLVENKACSGDTTQAFDVSRSGRRPQLESFNRGYHLIFLTIGGNDLYFADIVKQCLTQIADKVQDCDANLDRAEKLLKDGTAAKVIKQALRGIQQNTGDQTKVVLLGYPYLESNANLKVAYCKAKCGVRMKSVLETVNVGARIRNIGLLGDQVQQEVVNSVNTSFGTDKFIFVSTKALFGGPPNHEITFLAQTKPSLVNPKRWMIQPEKDASLLQTDLWYHPNKDGWAGEADLLIRDPRVPKAPPVKSLAPVPSSKPTSPIPLPTKSQPTSAPKVIAPCTTDSVNGPPTHFWNNLASSADGSHWIADSWPDGLYTSSDYGCNWILRGQSIFVSVASSSDGSRLVYAGNGQLATSSDFGETWKIRLTGKRWAGVATSSDGKVIAATVYEGNVDLSRDGGDTWAVVGPKLSWYRIVMSGDGKYQIASAPDSGGAVEVSEDFGKTWAQAADLPAESYSVAISKDGRHAVALSHQGKFFVSSDFGKSWIKTLNLDRAGPISQSDDGSKIIALIPAGGDGLPSLIRSLDYGATWKIEQILGGNLKPRSPWGFVMSGDTRVLIESDANGYLLRSLDFGNYWSPYSGFRKS